MKPTTWFSPAKWLGTLKSTAMSQLVYLLGRNCPQPTKIFSKFQNLISQKRSESHKAQWYRLLVYFLQNSLAEIEVPKHKLVDNVELVAVHGTGQFHGHNVFFSAEYVWWVNDELVRVDLLYKILLLVWCDMICRGKEQSNGNESFCYTVKHTAK